MVAHTSPKAINQKAKFFGLPVNVAILFFILLMVFFLYFLLTIDVKKLSLFLFKILFLFTSFVFLYFVLRYFFSKYKSPFKNIFFIVSIPSRAKKNKTYQYFKQENAYEE